MNTVDLETLDEKKLFTCLLGHPVAHSISPAMHNSSFEKLNINGQYYAYDVTKEELGSMVASLKEHNILGFNLTMPLKGEIIKYIDEIDLASELTNSVNTVVNRNGKLIGYTTDGGGYMDSLKDENIDITGKNMTVLGAGGAACSIISQAAIDGVNNIYILRRINDRTASTLEFAKKVSSMTNCNVSVHDIENPDEMSNCIKQSAIITNCTNVGMGDDMRSLVPKDMLRQDLIVSDIIYHPAMTPLLNDAKECGCNTSTENTCSFSKVLELSKYGQTKICQ